MNRIKLIAFDLDGTLCNTLKDIASSLNLALRYFGFPTYSDDEVSGLVGKSVIYMCKHAVPEGHEDEWQKLVDRWHIEYAAHLCDTTVPYDGMPETLSALRRQGIARRMVSMLIERAWNRGATEISLDATEAGRPLYRALGFRDSGECMVLEKEPVQK